jgi:hypothetical protein
MERPARAVWCVREEFAMGRFVIDFLESHDRASIVAELQRISALLGRRRITGEDIDRHGRISAHTVAQKFGTLRQATEAAGLIAPRYTKATDAELIQAITDLWEKTLRDSGRRPRMKDTQRYGCPVSSRTIVERFGTWKRALIAAAKANEDGMPVVAASPPEPVVKTRRPLSVTKRFVVLKRDRYRCRICRAADAELEVDHIVPVSRGGGDTLDNLQTLCKACNRSKSDRLM